MRKIAHVVNPEESAGALAVRASRHVLRDVESVVQVPRAPVDDTENNEIFGLDIPEVGLVSDTERTAGRVVEVVCVDDGRGLTRARQVRAEVTDITTAERSAKCI